MLMTAGRGFVEKVERPGCKSRTEKHKRGSGSMKVRLVEGFKKGRMKITRGANNFSVRYCKFDSTGSTQ